LDRGPVRWGAWTGPASDRGVRGEGLRLSRWLVVVTVLVAVFGVCLWLLRFASWSWMPHATSDRWVVAAAFATVTAGAAGAAGTWWASRDTPVTAGADGTAAGPSGPAAGKRAITAGGDINGNAATGDGARDRGVRHGCHGRDRAQRPSLQGMDGRAADPDVLHVSRDPRSFERQPDVLRFVYGGHSLRQMGCVPEPVLSGWHVL